MADTGVVIKSYRKEREKEITNKIINAMGLVGAVVERQAKMNVSKTPPGHPQVQTGRLRSSITHKIETSGREITANIGTNVEYGRALEFGTSKIPPYPWLFPAVEETKGKIIQLIKTGGGILGGIT